MNKIEHIGIAVKNLEVSNSIFTKILGVEPYKTEEIIKEGVKTSFLNPGANKIELLEATKKDSAIAKYIAKKGEGIHHISFAVENIYNEIERLKKLGFTPLNYEPRLGADNKLITFLHPKETNGVLIEMCMDRS